MAYVFEKNGHIIVLKKIIGETYDELFHRASFIMNNIKKGSFHELINKSHLYVNIFIRKNEYGSEIFNKFTKTYNCISY